MNTQLESWKGEFGAAYTDRNAIEADSRIKPFRAMLEGLELKRILEVGCNRGHNLFALRRIFPDAELFGIEPNLHALEIARNAGSDICFQAGTIFELPYASGQFDLVLTVGVLIHVPLDSLHAAIRELWRASSRYLLAVEYFAAEETVVPYRGQTNLLWKRNFLCHFEQCVPSVRVLRSGYLGVEEGFDRVHWWLLDGAANRP